MNDIDEPAGQAPRARNIALAERYLGAMAAGEWDVVEAMYHDDIRIHMAGDTPASGTLAGKAAVTGDLIARQVHAALVPETMRFARRWKMMCADDERVVIIMEGGGPTHDGDDYRQTYCEIFRFADDDRMIEMHAFLDTAMVERCLFGNPLAVPRSPLPPISY